MPHLQVDARYVVQDRIHGHWRHGRGFTATRPGHTKLYLSGLKPHTIVQREVFRPSSIYGRSTSNAVTLHVT